MGAAVVVLMVLGAAAAYVLVRPGVVRVRYSWRTLILAQLLIMSLLALGLQVRYDPYAQARFAGVDGEDLPTRRRPKAPYFIPPNRGAYREEVPGSPWRILAWPQVWAALGFHVALVLSIAKDRGLPRPRRKGSAWSRHRRSRIPEGTLREV